MHGNSIVRRAAQVMVGPIARVRPEMVLRLPERGFYFRSISNTAEGEWPLDEKYRPPLAFPVRAGWLSAVLAGHNKICPDSGQHVALIGIHSWEGGRALAGPPPISGLLRFEGRIVAPDGKIVALTGSAMFGENFAFAQSRRLILRESGWIIRTLFFSRSYSTIRMEPRD